MPDLYRGQGKRRCLVATFKALFAGEGRPLDDIDAARAELAARDDCTGRVGVIGFCMGGGFALLAASRGFDAAAPNYGQLPKDLDGALKGACPMVASFGQRDPELRGAAAKLEAALERAGVVHDVKEYPGAGHAFMGRVNGGPLNPVLRVAGLGYHQPSAEDAWGGSCASSRRTSELPVRNSPGEEPLDLRGRERRVEQVALLVEAAEEVDDVVHPLVEDRPVLAPRVGPAGSKRATSAASSALVSSRSDLRVRVVEGRAQQQDPARDRQHHQRVRDDLAGERGERALSGRGDRRGHALDARAPARAQAPAEVLLR